VLIVMRLDRLARSTRDLLNTLAGHHRPEGRLMLTVLGGLAEFERDLVRARTAKAGRGPWRAA
jgi:DNA invertase Pin-like site-specific DNA recombinase